MGRQIFLEQISQGSASSGQFISWSGTKWVAAGLTAALNSLANLDTTVGLLEQTGASTFTKRSIGTATSGSIITRDIGDLRFASISHLHPIGDITGLTSALAGKEPILPAGSVPQYLRGDRTWATLDSAAVGLDRVNNTSDDEKPISTAVGSALSNKEDRFALGTIGQYFRGDKTFALLNSAAVGLDRVNNTSDSEKPISLSAENALLGKEDSYPTGSTGEYWRGDKTWQALNKGTVGLANVDNTSDANKPVSILVQNALDTKVTLSLLGDVVATTGSGELTIQSGAVRPSAFSFSTSNLLLDGRASDPAFWGVVFSATGSSSYTQARDASTSTPNGIWAGYASSLRSPLGDGTKTQPSSIIEQISGMDVESGKALRFSYVTLVKAGFTGQGLLSLSFYDQRDIRVGGSTPIGTADYRSAPAGSDIIALSYTDSITFPAGTVRVRVRIATTWSSTVNNSGQFYVGDMRVLPIVDVASHIHAISEVTGLQSLLNAKEASLGMGTSAQYLRGDKTWQTLNKVAIGLANVDNTSDASKPISSAVQTALDGKSNNGHGHSITDVTGLQSSLDGKLAANLVSPFGLSLIGAASASVARSTLGLGSAALFNSGDFAAAIHAHQISDITNLSLSLADKQTKDARLTSLSSLSTSLGLVEQIGSDTFNKRLIGISAATSIPTRADADARYALISHVHSVADITSLQMILDQKESLLPSGGTVSQYLRGDKTWRALSRNDVGLFNVDNTTDANKPISSSAQTALNLKAPLANPSFTGTVTLQNDPTANLHAATKQYVDSIAQGLDAKQSVIAATLTNITLSGEQVIDGQTTSNSRVLVRAQTTAAQNGIYVSSSGVWSRAPDMNIWGEVPGAFTFVEQGATYGGAGWIATAPPSGTLGSTAITWSQFSGGGAYTGQDGVSVSGTVVGLAPMAPYSLKGNATADGGALPTDLTSTQVAALLPIFGSSTKGVVPSSGGGSVKFLRADGVWSAPDNNSAQWGNIIGTLSSQTDLQNALSAKLDQGSVSSFILTLLDDLSATDARTTLGLGTAATAAATSFAPVTHTHPMSDITGLSTTLTGKLNTSLVSTYALTLLDDTNAAAARATLGLGTAALSDATSFAPMVHSHSITDVTGLRSELDLKAPLDSPSFIGNVSMTTLKFGSVLGQMINLYSSTYGIGVQTGTQYLRTSTNFAIYAGGTHSSSTLNSGGGTTLFTVSATSIKYLTNTIYHTGNLVGATTSAAGLLSIIDKTKLDGIQTGATANATDTLLRDRTTHTGVQPISTVTGLQSALDDKLGSTSVSAFALTLLDDTSSSPARTTLGLGSISTRDAADFALIAHTHAIADVDLLQSALDARAPLSSPTFTGRAVIPVLSFERSLGAIRGIQWNSSASAAWSQYMASGGTTAQGPLGSLVAPTGSYVTSMALREFVENTAGYGWTWESGVNSATSPTIVAELSSQTGNFRTTGEHYVGTQRVYHSGNKPTKSDVGLSNADNTADANKPISTAAQAALDLKASSGAAISSGLTIASARLLGRTLTSTGALQEIVVGSGLQMVSGTLSANVAAIALSGSATDLVSGTVPAARLPAFSGDVSSLAGTSSLIIGVNKVTLPMMAQVSTATILGRVSAATGNVESLTAAQATSVLNNFTTTMKGLVPAPGLLAGKFLKDDGTWSAINTTTTWGSIAGLITDQTDLQTALAAKEDDLPVGNNTQFLRGDKTWQILTKTTVGLANVDNTSDANKPISTATQTSLSLKAGLSTTNEFTAYQKFNIASSSDSSTPSGCGLDINASYIRIGDAVSGQTFPNGIGIKFHDAGLSHGSFTYQSSTSSFKLGKTSSTSALMPFDDTTKVLNFNALSGELAIGGNVVYHSGNLVASGFDPITATGSGANTQTVTLPISNMSVNDIWVTINGVLEDPSEYSISGNQLTLYAPAEANVLIRKPSGSVSTSGYQAIDFFRSGKLVSGQTIAAKIAPYSMTLAINTVKALTAPVASTVISIRRNGTEIGTATFATSSTSAVVALTSSILTQGDILSLVAPSGADQTIQDIVALFTQ